MEANCPQQVATSAESAASHSEGLATAVIDRIGQLVCGLHGHDQIMQFDKGRMFLRCVSCGHESPGWQMPKRSPVLKFAGAARPEDQKQEIPSRPSRRVA
jgi:hypothetical protein